MLIDYDEEGKSAYSDNLCQITEVKVIPVFDIPVYINYKEFRYAVDMHLYCNYFVKLGLFVKYSILK